MKKLLLFGLLGFLFLKSCSDGNGNINAGLENSTFNVYFYYPGGKEKYLGQVRGLSSCQSSAWAFSRNPNDNDVSGGWSYVCCLQTSSSSCAEKHK
jgi:hypothetical protein